MLRSIRWRLALSFAAIALLATLVLGLVLLTMLQDYYAQRELSYLRGNASSMANVLVKMVAGNVPSDEVLSQIQTLAFLSQTRVRVYDANVQLLYDSGVPQAVDVGLGAAKQRLANEFRNQENPPQAFLRIISIGDKSQGLIPPPGKAPATPPAPEPPPVIIYKSLSVSGSPFGFDLNAAAGPGSLRSSQVVKQAIVDSQGKGTGWLELSDGPALGRDILSSVAWGWAAASAVAVLLAAGVGWLISRRISAPVLALTDATTRMAAGDLSTRAAVGGQDEVGQLAHSFNEMADQVETTVNALRLFVSDAAHELHTPLTALRANLDIAAEEIGAQDARVFVERAKGMVLRLEDLTSNLLDLSRLEANGHEARESVVDLAGLVKEQAEIYASQVEQAGHTFQLAVGPEPIQIHAEHAQVLRALGSLVDNACKFTRAGGTIRVEVDSYDDRARVSVSDTGIGIPEGDLARLFYRFHRGRNAASYPGSGLGLAIVQAIMEQAGGRVTVENLPVGARFTLAWPIIDAPA